MIRRPHDEIINQLVNESEFKRSQKESKSSSERYIDSFNVFMYLKIIIHKIW